MKEQNNIDKLFSEELQDFQMEYNQEEVWDNIQKDKRKKRGILWIWFSGLMFLSVISGFLYFGQPRMAEIASVIQHETIEQDSNDKNLDEKLISAAEMSSDVKDTENLTTEVSKSENYISLKKVQEEEVDIKGGARIEQITNTQVSDAIAKAKTKQLHVPSVVKSEEKDLVVNEVLPIDVTEVPSKYDDKASSSSSSSSSVETSRLLLDQIISIPWSEEELTAIIPTKLDFKEQKFEFLNKSDRFSLEYNASVYRPRTIFDNENNRLYTNLENESNRDMLAYSNQILGFYRLNDWFSISAGLEQMQVFHKFYWEELRVSTESIYNENALFTDIGGDITLIGDSTFSFVAKNFVRQSQQKLSLYSIPVGLTIHKKWNRWTVGTSLSGILNFSHNFSGFSFNENYNNTEKQARNRNYFQNDFSSSYEIRPYAEYELNNKIRLKVHANLRWNTTRAISNDLNVKSMFGGAGVAFRYVLN